MCTVDIFLSASALTAAHHLLSALVGTRPTKMAAIALAVAGRVAVVRANAAAVASAPLRRLASSLSAMPLGRGADDEDVVVRFRGVANVEGLRAAVSTLMLARADAALWLRLQNWHPPRGVLPSPDVAPAATALLSCRSSRGWPAVWTTT